MNQVPPPDDSAAVAETLAYLEACHLIFERGFLSHDQVKSVDCEVLDNITRGYKYFTEWLSSLIKKGVCIYFLTISSAFVILLFCLLDPKYPHTSSTQRSFLAWQSECTVSLEQAIFQRIYTV